MGVISRIIYYSSAQFIIMEQINKKLFRNNWRKKKKIEMNLSEIHFGSKKCGMLMLMQMN